MKNIHTIFLLLTLAGLLGSSCSNNPPADAPVPVSSTTDDADLDEGDYSTAYFINQRGDSLFSESNYTEAMNVYHEGMDSALVQADSFGYYDNMLDLATVFERTNHFDKAVELAREAVDAYLRSGDTLRIGRGYSTLGGLYGKAGRPAEQLLYTHKGFEILRQHPSLSHRCAAYNQMAFIYSGAGKWNLALPLLDSALMFIRQSGEPDLLPGMLLNVGDCRRNLQQWKEAKTLLEEALLRSEETGQLHVKARVLERLSQVAEAENQPSQALEFYKKAKEIRDSLFTLDKNRNLQELNIKYETLQKERELQALKSAAEIKALERNLATAVALLVSVALLFVYLKYRRDRRDLKQNKATLDAFTQLLLEKNARIHDLESDVSSQEHHDTPDADPDEEESEPVEFHYNMRILTENDWLVFKSFFEKTYPNFLIHARKTYPDLTSAEERLLLLLKLNFSRKEMASTLGISSESVKKGRQRLRKKLGLKKEDNLEAYVREMG